jgi:hypothetical protein
MAHYCKICGQYEENTDWIESCKAELEEHQMCFTCNHWRKQHDADLNERGEYDWAVVDGHHYVLALHKDSGFRGFDGRIVTVKFKDGTVRKCDNLWHQGEITNPYWRELMPDNAEIEW